MQALVLSFLGLIIVLTLGAYLMGRWASGYTHKVITSRVEAIDQIVNEERVPDAWLERYRRKVAKLRTSDADKKKVVRAKRQARKRALTKLERLRNYVSETGITANPETKRVVLQGLDRQKERWHDDEVWEELIDREPVEDEERSEAEA